MLNKPLLKHSILISKALQTSGLPTNYSYRTSSQACFGGYKRFLTSQLTLLVSYFKAVNVGKKYTITVLLAHKSPVTSCAVISTIRPPTFNQSLDLISYNEWKQLCGRAELSLTYLLWFRCETSKCVYYFGVSGFHFISITMKWYVNVWLVLSFIVCNIQCYNILNLAQP